MVQPSRPRSGPPRTDKTDETPSGSIARRKSGPDGTDKTDETSAGHGRRHPLQHPLEHPDHLGATSRDSHAAPATSAASLGAGSSATAQASCSGWSSFGPCNRRTSAPVDLLCFEDSTTGRRADYLVTFEAVPLLNFERCSLAPRMAGVSNYEAFVVVAPAPRFWGPARQNGRAAHPPAGHRCPAVAPLTTLLTGHR